MQTFWTCFVPGATSGGAPWAAVFRSHEKRGGCHVLGRDHLKALVGETVVAMSHELYRANIGVMNLDVVTSGGTIYRFATADT